MLQLSRPPGRISRSRSLSSLAFGLALAWALSLPQRGGAAPLPEPPEIPSGRALQSSDAQWFIAQVNRGLRAYLLPLIQAEWNNMTDITEAHQAVSAAANAAFMAYQAEVIPLAVRFDDVLTDAQTRRQLELLKRAVTLPPPRDPAKQRRLAEVSTQLASAYGSGRLCRGEGEAEQCRDLEALEAVLRESRDEPTLRQAWEDWREAMKGIHPLYRELVTLGNEGARSLGFADMGNLWRSGYEMSPEAFAAELDRLWGQVAPLYEALHCHARATLSRHYGEEVVPLTGPIPAHLFGNMWAQDWSGIYPLLIPAPDAVPIDVTAALRARDVQPLQMVRLAEEFFTSLGFDPLPQTFWERSLFAKPSDRDVVCHASAWDVELNNDLRVKQCIKVDHEDLITLHHELGHLFYYQSYYTLPLILQEGANDGFHEGIGDTLALSVTPAYLQRRGLIDAAEESPGAELNQLMQLALEKIAFLPFGLLVDQWRWRVFAGEVDAAGDNALWWSLRARYQGLRPPAPRPADAFDPGAKYHIPGNTPYTRYFLAHILQFQFHEALCRVAGHEGPLHRCSIYGSRAAGERLKAMLALGARLPWPEALAQVTGTREMDARPLLEYFAPLRAYLDEQNQGRQCGWSAPQ